MRKASIAILVLAAALLLLLPTAAFANYSIHGSYEMDTDACAGCHRAHTAASSITWTRSTDQEERSALLNSTATENYEFCYTCHDAVSLGAVTNVETGIYEGTTNGTPGAMLNGGGFDSGMFPAQHMYTGSSWGAYGGGLNGVNLAYDTQNAGESQDIQMTCSSCHDVHGSSNYRLLKDVVAGVSPADGSYASIEVGGYDPASPDPLNPDPTPFVISSEPGYPVEGWRLHEMGAEQVDGYVPNYTEPMYARAPAGDGSKGMSAWCAACHSQYTVNDGAAHANFSSEYDAGDGWGLTERYRHPVNIPLSNFQGGGRDLNLSIGATLPVAWDATVVDGAVAYDPADPFGSVDRAVGFTDADQWVDCLTCHRAHGSDVQMTGFANVSDSTDPLEDSGTGGVDPTGSNALLRLDNRGVCENCHNK